jgi:pyroglutamyl-peptidase
VADFEIPDNDGTVIIDEPISGNGAPAVMTTLPLRDIETALLKAGIPVRISATAGTFLCNATLYTTLSHAQHARTPPLSGFLHVPYVPEQVAELLARASNERRLETHQRADLASMDLATMVKAAEIALATAASMLN